MTNWCQNVILIRGSAEDIKRYKRSLLRDSTGTYYPWISIVPLPELKDGDEVHTHLTKEYNKTVFKIHYRVIDLEVIENNPGELELHFDTANGKAQILCTDELLPRISILHKYFEPMNGCHGFVHYVKGKVIASGHEVSEERDSPWEMYDYNPWPSGANPSEETLKNYLTRFSIETRY